MEFRITHINPLLANDFPPDFISSQKKEITNDFKFKFRLIDNDKIIYFEGMSARNDSFDSLDFFGSEYGCSDLQYFEYGKYLGL